MKIHRIEISGFGCLGDLACDLAPDRLNLLVAPNESGKSTLVMAILAALYGLETDRRRLGTILPRLDARTALPWGGTQAQVRLHVEAGGRRIRLSRRVWTTGARVHQEAAAVAEETLEDLSAELGGDAEGAPGRALLGLGRGVFLKTAFVAQGDAALEAGGTGLTDALQRLADSEDGRRTAQAAIDAIEQALHRYSGTTSRNSIMVDTEIRNLGKMISDLQVREEEIEDAVRASVETQRRSRVLAAERDELKRRVAVAQRLALEARLVQIDEAVERASREAAELEALERRLDELEDVAGFPLERLGEIERLYGQVQAREQHLAAIEARIGAEIPAASSPAEVQIDGGALPSRRSQLAGRQSRISTLRHRGAAARTACGLLLALGLLLVPIWNGAWMLLLLIPVVSWPAFRMAARLERLEAACAERRQVVDLLDADRSLLATAVEGTGVGGDVPAALLEAVRERSARSVMRRNLERDREALLSRRVLPAAAFESERAILRQRLEEPRPEGCPPLVEGATPAALDREAADLRRRAVEVGQESKVVEDSLRRVRTRQEEELPQIAEDLAQAHRELEKATMFRDAAREAIAVLDEISRDVHAQWATRIEEEVAKLLSGRLLRGEGQILDSRSEILEGRRSDRVIRRSTIDDQESPPLLPGFEEFRIDPDLRFRLRRAGRVVEVEDLDGAFSAGARDLVYLAVRIALTRYMSSLGEPLPLILDEPFATLDDDRFVQAMDLLADLGVRTQLVVVSCHGMRHRWWANGRAGSIEELQIPQLAV